MACAQPIGEGGFVSGYPNLLSPFSIGRVGLRNRVVFQPHFTALGHLDGMPSDDHVAHHEERARGGVGLIILDSMAIYPTGKMLRRFVNAWDPAVVPGLRAIVDAVHRHGTKLFGNSPTAGIPRLKSRPIFSGRRPRCLNRQAIIRRRRWMRMTFAPSSRVSPGVRATSWWLV